MASKIISNYRNLPKDAKRILTIGLIVILVAAIPLLVWALLTQRFDLRKKASTSEAPIPTPIRWSTKDVTLVASDFYIDINGKRFTPNQTTVVHSVSQADSNYITLIANWTQDNIFMGVAISYKLSNGTTWYQTKFETSNPGPDGGYVEYNKGQTWTMGIVGHPPNYFNPADLYTDPSVGGHAHFSDLRVNLPGLTGFPNTTMTPSPYPSPTSYPYPTPTAVPTSNPNPSPKPLDFRVKFGGVTDGSADGAKATIRFVNAFQNLITSPVSFSYIGNGIYRAIVIPDFSSILQSTNNGIGNYTFYIKGEKHSANKFCEYNQSGPCVGTGNLPIPYETAIPMPVYDFTGYSLQPGDLPPQDGKVDSSDFQKVSGLLGKLCSEQTAEDLATADLDYNGCVNIKDAFLLRKTLETKYDEY